MKNSTLMLSLVCVLFCFQTFSQESKPNIKPDPEKILAVNKNLESKAYCPSTYTDIYDDWITNVTIGLINNTSGQNGSNSYGDYTYLSANIQTGVFHGLYVTFYSGGWEEHVWAWIDWDHDDIFDEITESYDLGYGADLTLNTFFEVPQGAHMGTTRLRVIEQYNSDPGPCDAHPTIYGETEDYSINVTTDFNTWTGAVDNNWHNPDNWYYHVIPDASMDVTITNVTNKCWVYAGTAYCNNITVEYGSGYDLRVWNQDLYVSGNMNMYGQLLMDHTDGNIITYGDVLWESGSRASIQADAIIEVHGDWIFKSGSIVTLNNGEVRFAGSGTYLRNFSSNSYLNNVVVYKASSEWLSISSNTTNDLRINGNLQITAGGTLYIYSPHSVILGGNLHSSGYMYCYDGNFIFDGNTQNISVQLGYTTIFQFHNLKISSTGSTTILNKDILINNDFTIESGQFVTNDHTINISGDWNNQVGPVAFVEGAGRVIFSGSPNNIFGNEDFYTIEVDKDIYYYSLKIENGSVTCQHYDWTNGGIYTSGGGTFTAYDLIDNGIFGEYTTNGGTINISNYGTGQYVDLNGKITLYVGFMNVYGGSTPSYWPFAGDAEINISSGVLDFHDQGIFIYDSPTYTLTENITGGIIRTARGFWGESSNFTPDYGTTEFYGNTDASIYTINGCNLNSIRIDKSSKGDNKSNLHSKTYNYPLVDERSGKLISNGTKSNTIEMTGFVDVNGSVQIESGILNTNGHSMQVVDHWTNNVGDGGFIESNGTVFFDGTFNSWLYTDETFYNLILNKPSYANSLNTLQNVEIDVLNNLNIDDGIFNLYPNSKLRIDGNLFIAFEACLNPDSGSEIEIGGDWTNENFNNTQTTGYWKGGEIVTFIGAGDQILSTNVSEETFGNIIINKPGGYFRPNDNIHIHGGLIIQDGDWWDNMAGLDHWLTGHILIEADGGYFPEGTTTFKGLNYQTYQNNGGYAVFGDVVIDKHYTKSGEKDLSFKEELKNVKGGTLELNSDMVVFNDHNTTIVEGTLDLNGHTFKATGWIDILDGGILNVDAGAELILGSTLWCFSGGQFITTGESGNKAHIHNDAVGQHYSIDIYGGTISANHTIFEDLAPIGIEVWDGAVIDLANSFNNCSFDGYTLPGGSTWLKIENHQTLSIDNISFPYHPGGSLAHNIGKDSDWGQITITSTSGAFTGPLYENDPHDRIDWTDFPHGRWTGNVSSDWFNPMNWADFTVPGAASDVVIQVGVPNYPIVNNSAAICQNITIESGASLEIGNNELTVADTTKIHGELIMTNNSGKLTSEHLKWHAGSSDYITAGEIHNVGWYWYDGTNAAIGTGNTAFVSGSILTEDPDASFGNLELIPYVDKGNSGIKAMYPVYVSGYCIVRSGAWWTFPGVGLIINGDWVIESGATLNFSIESPIVCHSNFSLNGTLNLYGSSEAIVHGMFYFNSGLMVIDNSSFICDYSLPSGWIDIIGGIDMVSGSLEFPDANISFVGGQYISGGAIIAGRSVHADLPGVFQPTGATLELVGSSTGHYLQITNSNYVYDLNVNRSAPIGIHPGSPLVIQGSVNINSEFILQGNTLAVYGDLDINGGDGVLNINDNAMLAMADSRWLSVNSGGTLEVIGSPGNEAILTHSSGYYHFWTGNGCTIRAIHAVFEYMDHDGILLNPGAFVDPAFPFNNCTFRNGFANGRLLSINSDQTFTVTDAIFPTNTWSGNYNVYKDVDAGSVNFIGATGAFSGESFEYDPHNRIHWGITARTFELDVFLEGPFNPATNEMTTGLNTILPTTQPYYPVLPYFGNPMPDWYYGGSESVVSIPTPYIIDWIVVQLREGTSPGTATNILATQAAFLTDDGHVVGLDGVSPLSFSITYSNNLYAVIWHRNHLGVISANPLVDVSGLFSYDFSSGSGQAHGGTSAQKQIGSKWVMMSGDGNGDGQISYPDISDVWNLQAGNASYLESDYNMNRQVSNQDKNDNWAPNLGSGSYIPE